MSSVSNYILFTPLTIGKDLTLKNRVIMSPMGRARANLATREPTEATQLYYEQRASAGLIVTEATPISEETYAWMGAPALYTEAHADAWKKVTDRVHAKGGKIFMQLWHMGRKAHSSFNPKNEIVAPSAIPEPTRLIRTKTGENVPAEVPRALETHEVARVVDDFRKSAALAKKAGFDGVELHAANGYLFDQFLHSSSNQRTDQYGGSIENRTRFLLEVIDAIKTEWPADRIGVRLSPNFVLDATESFDHFEQFTYAASQLNKLGLAYLTILNGPDYGNHKKGRLVTVFDIKSVFKGTVVANWCYTRDTAEGVLRSGAADAVAIGTPFISNPDLVERYLNDWPVAPDAPQEDWWYASRGDQGYVTYPAYKPTTP